MDGKGSMLRDDDRGEEKKKSIIGDQCKGEEEGNRRGEGDWFNEWTHDGLITLTSWIRYTRVQKSSHRFIAGRERVIGKKN